MQGPDSVMFKTTANNSSFKMLALYRWHGCTNVECLDGFGDCISNIPNEIALCIGDKNLLLKNLLLNI